ncbi:MAG: hypothetical protein KKE24_00860 [Candidatus Thermoplasmatota archaeon]|nr:hypothetical protein [Candidatus Thermoplasmatota archaeon]
MTNFLEGLVGLSVGLVLSAIIANALWTIQPIGTVLIGVIDVVAVVAYVKGLAGGRG